MQKNGDNAKDRARGEKRCLGSGWGSFCHLGLSQMDILPPFTNSFYFFSSLSFLLMQTHLTPLHKKTLKGSFSGSGVCLQTRNQHLSPTAPNLWHFQNQHNTKGQADSLPLWVVLFPIFSPPQPPYLLRIKRENFCPENKKKDNQTRKGHFCTHVV